MPIKFDPVYLLLVICPSSLTRDKGQKGLTLLELMIVIAIIGTLAAIAVPNYIGYLDRARYATAVTMMRQIDGEIKYFYLENDSYPETLAQIGLGSLKDPWTNPYQYLNITTAKGKGELRKDRSTNPLNTDFDLYSMGRDGQSKLPLTVPVSYDDIIRANDGAFFGRASEY